jgi:3-oxoacyl-[acyl-carrier protein] reductase
MSSFEKPLSNRVIAVTGAGRGIGRATVQQLLQRGAKVAALDVAFPFDNVSSSSSSTSTPKEQDPPCCVFLICDVLSETSVTETFANIVQTFGRLDGLVNNAGVILEKPITETTLQDFDRTVGVNLRGTFLCAKMAVLQFQKQQLEETNTKNPHPPAITNIASEIGHSGLADYTVYTASKGAIYTFTRSLALELAPHNILVNNVAPGPTDTPMLQSETNYPAWQKGEGIPLGRIGTPDDVAKAVCFLQGPDATFITGSTIDVNGGAVMY